MLDNMYQDFVYFSKQCDLLSFSRIQSNELVNIPLEGSLLKKIRHLMKINL